MTSVKSNRYLKSFVFCPILFLTITFSSFDQSKQSYRNHQEIEVAGGMKVEILKCTGDGPTEICDCIYFTDKRQNGTRMRQNANQLKEEERAALLAKGVKNPLTRKTSSSTITSTDNRPDKAIPSSIIPKPKPAHPQPTLEDAVKKADSVAKVSSQKMKETLLKVAPADDSTEMDQVFIPRVTETGGTRLDPSAPKVIGDNASRRDSLAVAKSSPLDTVANVTSLTAKVPVSSDSISKTTAIITNALPVKTPSAGNNAISAEPSTKGTTTELSPSNKTASAENAQASRDTIAKAITTTIDNSAISTPPANTISTPVADSTENNWVKQYQHVKKASDSVSQMANNPLPNETKRTDSAVATNDSTLKTTLKNELKAIDSVSNTAVVAGKASKKKEVEVKEPVKVLKDVTKQSTSSSTASIQDRGIVKEKQANGTDPASGVSSGINGSAIAAAQPDTAIVKTEVNKEKVSDTSSVPSTPVAQSIVTHNDPVVSTTNATNNTTPIENEGRALLKNTASATDKNVIGKSAEVNTKGEWEKATIIDKETEFLYKVHYRGTTADRDEWVSVTQIRNIDTAATASATTRNKPGSEKPLKVPKVNVNCSFEAPAPPVSNGEKFSEKLAKRKIYEQYVNAKNTVKTGVTFLSMQAESPYVNTVSISATNNLEIKFSFAPAGAMIYPVKTEFKICEQVLGKTSSKTVNANYACFRNKEGAWTCTNVE